MEEFANDFKRAFPSADEKDALRAWREREEREREEREREREEREREEREREREERERERKFQLELARIKANGLLSSVSVSCFVVV